MNRVTRLLLSILAAMITGFSYAPVLCAADKFEPAKDAPLVSITYPTPNLTLDQARTNAINVQATAFDADEAILYVRFMVCVASGSACSGSVTTLGPATANPYQVRWALPQVLSDRAVATPYLIWAEAQNTLGQARISATVPFTIAQPAPGPSVKLVAPNGNNNEVGFVSPASPVLFATATPGNTFPISTIARVEFLDGESVIGSVSAPNSSPAGYTFVWRGVSPGAHSVTARAVDSLGNSTLSDTVTIYVLNSSQPPKVTLLSPSTGQNVTSKDSVSLSATVTPGSGRVQRVEFIAGTTIVATALSSPYSGNWVNPPAGNYTITARAIDDLGASTASNAAYLQVIPAPRVPSAVVTSPAPGSSLSSTTPVVVMANALAPDGNIGRVDFYAGSTLIGSSSVAPYRVTWTTPAIGKIVLTAKAYDLQGISGTSSSVNVTVVNSQPPTATIAVAPAAAAYAAPATVKLTASATAPGSAVSKIDFLANGAVLATRTSAPYEFAWTSIAAGVYSVTARVTDSLNSTATSSPLTVKVVNNAAPSVQLTTPSDGQMLYAGQPVAFAATASDIDGSINKVEFLVDGAAVATSLVAPFTGMWNATGIGSHVLSARATDNLGGTATSTPRNVTVAANALPTIALTAPSANQAFTLGQPLTLSATSTDADGATTKVEFMIDGSVVATSAAAPFNQSWLATGAGAHLVTARATDNRGAISVSPPIPITVVTTSVPVVSLIAPVAGRTFSVGAPLALAASAAVAGATIARVEFYAGSTLIGTSSAQPYSTAWAPTIPGTYSITAKGIDSRGLSNVSAAVSTKIVTPSLTVATPVANASIAADFVNVIGAYQAPPNSGVTINGETAKTDGKGNYHLNNFHLVSGVNTITVVLTTPDGQASSQTVTVTSTANGRMRVYADVDVAFAPATFTVRFQNRTGIATKTVSFQNLVGAQLDSTVVDQTTLGKLTYTTAGLYRPTFVVTDIEGNTYSQSLTLLVRDKIALDAVLKEAWSDFASSLVRGDKNAALLSLTTTARAKYGPILDALAPYAAEIVPTWSVPITGSLGEEVGEFMVRRSVGGVNQLFFVYFVKDGYGIWRLGSM